MDGEVEVVRIAWRIDGATWYLQEALAMVF
jgi:hypothetical protein